MTFIHRLLNIPVGEKSVEAIELYEVHWMSRHGEYSSSVRREAEFFPSLEEASEFAVALKNAFKLLKHTGEGTKVEGPVKRK